MAPPSFIEVPPLVMPKLICHTIAHIPYNCTCLIEKASNNPLKM